MSDHTRQPWGHKVTFTVYVPGPVENAHAVSEGALFPACGVEVDAQIDVVQNEPTGQGAA